MLIIDHESKKSLGPRQPETTRREAPRVEGALSRKISRVEGALSRKISPKTRNGSYWDHRFSKHGRLHLHHSTYASEVGCLRHNRPTCCTSIARMHSDQAEMYDDDIFVLSLAARSASSWVQLPCHHSTLHGDAYLRLAHGERRSKYRRWPITLRRKHDAICSPNEIVSSVDNYFT